MSADRVVVVGGGPAGRACSFELRKRGYAGEVVLVAAEELPPYDRTLLSKDVLGPGVATATLLLDAPAKYADAGIELMLGVRATGLDVERRMLLLDGGHGALSYDRLVLACGRVPVCPPSLAAPGVHVLRTHADAARLRADLERCARLTIVGAGFVGSEVAATARARGLEVTLIEALPAPLAAVLGTEVGTRIADLHREHGVDLRLGTGVEGIARRGPGYALALAGGGVVESDAVLVAVGAQPSLAWLAGTPLAGSRTIAIDAQGSTAVDGVFAAGDCASRPGAGGRALEIEHWDSATRDGRAVAAAVLDEPRLPRAVPFFWSEQHGVRFQLVGAVAGFDRVDVEPADGPFAFVARYVAGDRVTGVFAADAPRAIADARRLLQAELVA